jgi:hypothetical protein
MTEPAPIRALPHGIHADIPEHIYHARVKDLASKSGLDIIRRAPSKWIAYLNGHQRPPTDDMVFGTTFHAALLEPDRYASEYVISPEFGDLRAVAGRTTKEEGAANKAAKAAWLASHQGVKLVEPEDHANIAGMVASCRAHPLVGPMLDGSMREATVRWRDPDTGVECKARLDTWKASVGIALDVKTAGDASADGFVRAVENYGYHRQSAMYQAGLAACGAEVRSFRFLVIEKEAPWDCAVYDLGEESLMVGHRQNARALATMARCLETDIWPGYPTGTTTLALRPWAMREE